ncbi:hypothetical protein [Halorussus lipolyticus]|uniref:hypothetical protein n=1 Tax=Halorussus lipolyticus TaxID=3034024 RepID=UPI0023E87735|nr:hypothetical protein [Halorussus sp. DT80]
MQPQTSDLLQAMDDLSTNVLDVNNLSRSVEKRNTVTSQIEEMLSVAKRYKQEVKNSDAPCKCANRILSIELTLECWKHELTMWNDLREEQWESAWENMVRAQLNAQRAVQADKLGEKFGMKNYHKRLNSVETLLFPDQLFTSPGMKTGTAICSICDSEYSECSHIKNRAYNGEICFTEITDITEVDHIAIVEDPANKLQRITPLE